MKTKITILKDEQCSQCFADLPKGSKAIYDDHLFCGDDCYMEWVLECEEMENEL